MIFRKSPINSIKRYSCIFHINAVNCTGYNPSPVTGFLVS